MNTLDYIIIVAIAIGFIYGYFRGIIKQLSFSAGFILGIITAMLYYPVAGEEIHKYTNLESWICIPLGFIAILFSIIIIFKILGVLLLGLLKLIHFDIIDKVLGSLFAAVMSVLLFAGIVELSGNFAPDNAYTGKTKQKESVLYPYTKLFTSIILEEAESKM